MKSGILILLLLMMAGSAGEKTAKESNPATVVRSYRRGLQHGTLIVFVPAKDKFIVAADSRVSVRGAKTPPDDDRCKIFPLGKDVLFATSGISDYTMSADDSVGSWTNLTEAQKVVRIHAADTGDPRTMIKATADAWSEDVRAKLTSLYQHHRDLVEQVAKPPDYVLTTGIFATARNGKLAFAAREIILEANLIGEYVPTCGDDNIPSSGEDNYCLSGQDTIAKEFAGRKSPRAVAEFSRWVASARAESKRRKIDIRTLYAIRLIELTELFDAYGYVGGRVDAVELSKDGKLSCPQLKPSCSCQPQ